MRLLYLDRFSDVPIIAKSQSNCWRTASLIELKCFFSGIQVQVCSEKSKLGLSEDQVQQKMTIVGAYHSK